MKAIPFALFVALLMIGCGESSTPQAIDLDDKETLDEIVAEAMVAGKIQFRGKEGEKLAYAPNEQTPYTGWAKTTSENGQIQSLLQWKDGKQDGLETSWYEDGQKKMEAHWKDGKLMSAVRWKPNGEKCPVTNVVGGNGVVVSYYEDGREIMRVTYKAGKLID